MVQNHGAKSWCKIMVQNHGAKSWCKIMVLLMKKPQSDCEESFVVFNF
jgi:hypothetical protein